MKQSKPTIKRITTREFIQKMIDEDNLNITPEEFFDLVMADIKKYGNTHEIEFMTKHASLNAKVLHVENGKTIDYYERK